MTKSIATGIITFLFLSCSPALKLKKVNAGEIAENHKTAAYNFAERQLKCCKTGEYTPLNTSIAVPEFVQMLTVEEMKQACVDINTDMGELDKLTLVEILRQGSTYMYRFKAIFLKTGKEMEVRVGTDMNHKFIGLMFKDPWFDKYYKFREEPKG